MVGISYCNRGDVRTTNEDRVLIRRYTISDQEWGMFLVADGMGGGRGGEASQTIIDILSYWWDNDLATILSLPFDLELVVASLDRTLAFANSSVFVLQQNKSLASTLSLVMIFNGRYVIRHVGDSRIYLISGGRIVQQTTEHTTVNESGKQVLTKCMGAKNTVSFYEADGSYRPDDMFLICSDGLYKYVADETILSIALDPSIPLADKPEALRSCITQGEALDNISIILVGDVKNE